MYYHSIILSYYHTIILPYYHTVILSYHHAINIILSCTIILSYHHTRTSDSVPQCQKRAIIWRIIWRSVAYHSIVDSYRKIRTATKAQDPKEQGGGHSRASNPDRLQNKGPDQKEHHPPAVALISLHLIIARFTSSHLISRFI